MANLHTSHNEQGFAGMSETGYSIDKSTKLPIIDKGDGETLDYPFDFTELLTDVDDKIANTTGSAVNYLLSAGLSLVSQQNTDYVASPLISGGTIGTKASVRCTITTLDGRVFERTILLNIKESL